MFYFYLFYFFINCKKLQRVGTFSTATAVSVGGGSRKHQVMKAYHLWTSSSTFWFCLAHLKQERALNRPSSFLLPHSSCHCTPKHSRFTWHVSHVFCHCEWKSGYWQGEKNLASSDPGSISSHIFSTYNSHNKSYRNSFNVKCKAKESKTKRVNKNGK